MTDDRTRAERAEAELAALRGRIQALAEPGRTPDDEPLPEWVSVDDLRALLVPVDAPTSATDTPDTTTEQEAECADCTDIGCDSCGTDRWAGR